MSERYSWGGDPRDRMDCSPLLAKPSSDTELKSAVDALRRAERSRTWRDALRCLIGRHRPAVSVVLDTQTPVQRCSCGAIRMWSGRPWLEGDPLGLKRRAVRKAMNRLKKQIGDQ